MAWDWLKDNNDEPNEFKPIDARGLLDGKEYHDYWTTKLHNGLANVPKSLLGAVESIPAMAARTRPVVMQELENDLDGTGLMDSDADKAALSEVEKQITNTTAPIWEGARLGVKSAKDALPDANWESNVDESQLSYPKKIGGMIVENAPLMAAQLGASIINPALGVALMAGSIAGDAYNDLTEKGVDPLTAGQAGWLDAAAQAPLEGVGEMGWLKAFRELGTEGAAKLMGKAFVKEGLTEAIQEFPDETIPYIAEHGSLDGFDWSQLASNAVDAGVVGGIYGGGFAGIGRAINGKAQAPQQEVGQDGEGADNGNGDAPSSSPAMHAMNRLVNELGIDPKAASGIVGGLMLESGGNTTDISPTAKNPKSGSYGIGQWLGSRQDDLMAFAEKTGGDPNDLDTQISFLIHELKGSESGALQEILKAQTPDEAGRLADQFYERSEGTAEIRNQKAANAQKIYDIFVNGGADPNAVYKGKQGSSSVPNPKSAEDFLKDLEATIPADTDEDVEKLNVIHKAIQDKNKKAQEELAAQYGWSANSPETSQDATEGDARENANRIPLSGQSAERQMTIPRGNSNAISGTKQISTNSGMYPSEGLADSRNKAVYTPKKPTGAQYVPQGGTQGKGNKGGVTAVQPNTPYVIPAPNSIKEPARNASTSLPSAEQPTYESRKVNGIADRQRRDRQISGNKASAATQGRINKALKNNRLRQVVKQAFVDGDKDALNRLGAMQINQDVLQAVKDDVMNTYHKVEPVVPPKAIPAQEPYTPRYGSRNEAMRIPHEREAENARGDIPVGGGNGIIVPRSASTPSEAMRLDNTAREGREANENKSYDIGRVPSRKAQRKAAIAQKKQERRDAENTNFRKYEPKPYTTRYDNREGLNKGMHDVYENKSDEGTHADQISGVSSTGKNERAGSQNHVDSRDMSEYADPNAPNVVATPKDRKSIEADMRNRQQNRNKYEAGEKNGFEKPSISKKENNHENTKKNQPVHHPEENKNVNAKPEQSKPSEGKDGKTPESKNPVKKAPPEETPSSGKKEETQKTKQKQDDKVVVRNSAADNDARDAAQTSKEIGNIDAKASNKAKTFLRKINKCLVQHRAGSSTSAETIDRIRESLRGKSFANLPEAVKAKLNEYAEKKIEELKAFDKEHPWAEKEAADYEDSQFDDTKDMIDRIVKMLDSGVMTLDEAIERANKVAGELKDMAFADTGTSVSHAADRAMDYFNQKIGDESTETPKTEQPKVEPTKTGAKDTENATPKVESKEPGKKGNGAEQDKPVGTTEPPKKSEDAKPKDEIDKDDAAVKDAKKICDDAIREVDAIADEFTKAVKSNPDSLPDVSNFVEKLKAVLDRAKAETRAIKTNTSETAEKIHKMWLGINDHILQKASEADKLFADFYSRKSYIPEHDIPMVEEFARKLYKCLNKFANSSGNTQSFVEAIREMKALESQINGMTANKAVRRALEDSYAAHMYHIYRMYFEHKTVEPRKSDTEYSMEDVRILAKKRESKKTVEEDEKALALLGQDLYDRAYKPIADYLRIVGDASRGDAFESAVLFAKMMESFHKNYGIWFPVPHLVKAVARRGKTFTILGTFSPNANSFILSKLSNGEVFAHEATHMYESMLRAFSTLTNEDVEKYFSGDKKKAREAIEKIRADLKAIDEWTSYSEEHLREYEGTVLYTEFRKHASAVKRGTDIGERTWRTERLARGFTQYLGEGNRAPTKELEGVFARIKQWVLDAYGTIKNLTKGKLPPDMEKFYQSMISGDTEYFKNMANRGKSATVRTDDGKEFEVSYKIVPAETLIASNTADFGKNENYPANLQPRDRDRVSMKERVDDMARNLRPEDLAESRSVNQGAPLVNQDNVVENGNGRTMAITRAYTTDGDAYKASSQKYKQYLMEHAEEYGYTREEVEAMQNPVLIRQRDASSDSLQDSIIHSTEGGMKMSASQQAKVDAEKISPKTLSLYDYDGTGDLTKRSNNDFVVSALNEIADKSERDVVFNKDGTPSKAGIERVKSALAAYAYGDNSLLERISESTDTKDQNIVKAFSAAAPQVAAIKAKLDKGDVSKDYDLPKLLSDVLDFYFKCKNDGKSIKFALNETSLFGDNQSIASISGKNLARFIADNIHRPKAISDALVKMTKYIDGANEPGVALFSGGKMGLDEIVRTAVGLNASKFIPASKPNARKYKHTIQPKENTWNSMPTTQRKACVKLMEVNGGHYDTKTKSFGFTDEKARDAALNVLEAYLSADSKASAKTPYQKMVENITPIASDDLTACEQAIVDFAKKMGLQVQFFEGDQNLHGFHADGTNVVFLNRHSAMDLNQTFWHETFHWMRESNPDLYNQMVKEVFGDEVSEKQLADYAASIGRTDMSKELAIEEMLADAMWDASRRGSFFEKLGIEHPSLCAKIIKWIKNLYEDFKAHFHNPQAGLTNTQIKRMSNTLSKIAEKLVDGDGNKLFSVDEKGNIKETAAGKRAVSGEARFSVTNESQRAYDEDDIESIDPHELFPLNETDNAKVERLTARMTQNGWDGRPLLVFKDGNGAYTALTGSHRIKAAQEGGLEEIPAIVIQEDGKNDFSGLLEARDDDARLYEANELYSDGGIPKAARDLLAEEVEQNGSSWKYRVTNKTLNGNDRMRITELTGDIKSEHLGERVDRVCKMLEGCSFVVSKDGVRLRFKSNKDLNHFAAGNKGARNKETRLYTISNEQNVKNVIENSVYVEEERNIHNPNSKTHFAQFYSVVKSGNNFIRMKISAKKLADGTFDVQKASLYNIATAGSVLHKKIKKLTQPAMNESMDNLRPRVSSFTVSVADMLDGVNDRNGNPYVVNGKLQYEDGVIATKNMLSSEPTTRHSVEDLKAQTLSVFPNAQNIEVHDNGVSFDLPNGSHVEVNFTDDTISVDRAKAQEDYGGTLKGDEKASGKIEMVGKDALITLTMDSPDETVSHEAMHLAWNLLTDKERNALLRAYGSEEGAAEGMREWKIRRKMRQGTITGKIMQKISDMAHKLLSLFRENDQHVFQKLESGEIWERGNENNTAARNVKYKMNPLNEAEKYFKSHRDFGKKAGGYINRTFRPDLTNAKANPNISVNETKKKKGWGVADTALNNTVRSPSRISSPKTSYIWGLADAAQREMQELRGKWTHSFAGAIKNLNDKEKARYTDILWEEDLKQHVFSDKELRDAGVSEKVIKAHQKTRSLLGRIYNAVNAVYTRERVENFTYKTRKEAEEAKVELAKRPHTFVMHDIRETVKDGKPAFQVSIKTGGYREVHSVVTAEEMKKLDADKDVYIKARKQLDDGSFKVSYLAYNKPLANMEGYMPHIFHGVLIVKKYVDEDGNTQSRVVGSAESIDKAVVNADAMQKEEGGEFIIAPKEFSSEGEIENPLLLGDMDYFKLMENLRKGASLTLDEAREMTHATMKGRHVYYGAKKHRKGAEGFEKNAIWVIQHHIDSSSRYVALDPFKQKAINFFERAFGDYNKDWTGEAAFCKGYIDSVLGKPSRLETLANDFLHLFPWFKNEARPARRMAGNLTGLTGVLKLGASVASGFVNTLQLFNCVGYVGARKTAVGLKRALHPNATDKKILVASGVSEESGLALDSIGHIKAEGTALSKAGNVVNRVNDFLMKPFTFAEKTIRKATILAAYYKAIGDGLSKGEAIQYARNINRKVNFDYSVADAPRIFRALQGTVIGDMALQFQKYGVKEMEVISDFLPFIGNTTTKQKLEFFIPYLLVSGIWNAFPFEDALLSLLKLLGFDDPEKEAKRAMMEWAGNNPDRKALVNVANYGAGSLVGVDISQRVGLKGAVPETSNVMTGGPLGSTTVQLAKAVLNGDTNGAMKAISPAAGNIYGAVAGYNTDSKGRKTVDYDAQDRIARGLGFRTVKEANATDAQGIIYNYKEQKKDDRAKAKSEYLKDPSSSNRQKLKALGYSDKEIKALKDDKQSTRVERSQTGLSKEDKKKLKPVFDYVQ